MIPSLLVTSRLYLRSFCENDVETLYHNYCSDIERSRFLTREPHTDSNQTLDFLLKWCHSAWEKKSSEFAWIIALKSTNEAIGISLVILEEHKAQIHYGINRDYERQGFITEAGFAITEWLKSKTKIREIWTLCDVENYGSINVLHKLGFSNLGVLKSELNLPAFGNEPRDCFLFKLG
ncbi:MAG: GNAT family N-acetyltransferase [Tatlockia sp.]|nr:GNAT family N-acetyltransferase [Tatlockia sp.]